MQRRDTPSVSFRLARLSSPSGAIAEQVLLSQSCDGVLNMFLALSLSLLKRYVCCECLWVHGGFVCVSALAPPASGVLTGELAES